MEKTFYFLLLFSFLDLGFFNPKCLFYALLIIQYVRVLNIMNYFLCFCIVEIQTLALGLDLPYFIPPEAFLIIYVCIRICKFAGLFSNALVTNLSVLLPLTVNRHDTMKYCSCYVKACVHTNTVGRHP